ncbi:MAG TPA: hypothetical protein VFK15_00505 [Burkholderiales bacterium]|jgi:hypothetical protein|nr:hypothetical protein [Burkholderiales bacterium]
MPRRFLFRIVLVALVAPAATAAVAAQSGEEAAASPFAVLYNERHRLVAFKDVCSRVLPKLRRDTQAAYEEWVERHEEVLENLEARFLAMVKQASRNQTEYSENYRKYHAVVEQERQAQKDAFLKMPKEDLIKECKLYPGYLRSADSDMPNRYPEEFAALYGRKP